MDLESRHPAKLEAPENQRSIELKEFLPDPRKRQFGEKEENNLGSRRINYGARNDKDERGTLRMTRPASERLPRVRDLTGSENAEGRTRATVGCKDRRAAAARWWPMFPVAPIIRILLFIPSSAAMSGSFRVPLRSGILLSQWRMQCNVG